MEGCFMFHWGGGEGGFSDGGGASLLCGGCTPWGASILMGGEVSKKIVGWGKHAPQGPPPPTMGNPVLPVFYKMTTSPRQPLLSAPKSGCLIQV